MGRNTMVPGKKYCGLGMVLVTLIPLSLHAKIIDPDHVLGPYSRAERKLERSLGITLGHGRLEQIELQERVPNLDADTRYLLMRMKLRELDNQGHTLDAMKLCANVKADDYEWLAQCNYLNPKRISEVASAEAEKLLEKSLRDYPGTIVASRVSITLLNIAFEATDISRAREFYQKAMQITPPEARKSQLDLIWTAANIYSSSLNSPKLQRESMKLYDLLEDAFRKDPDSRELADIMCFNKGLSQVTVFRNYEAALQEFSKIPRESRPWLDAQIYSALAYFRLNQPARAKEILSGIDLDQHTDLQRLPSLACYRAIVAYGLRESKDISACFEIMEKSTGPDTAVEITRELMQQNLPPELQLRLLLNFWQIYSKYIEPKVQQIMENNTNAVELARVRTENLVKDLDMQNFKLLKIIAAGLIAGLFMSGFMLWNVRKKNKNIQKLQTYIQQAVLARFLPPIIVDEIVQGRSRLEAEPKDELITLMFCDIVGFTALSENMGRPETVALLNDFMQVVTETVYRHEGTIDKFIGDAAMVIFGAPTPLDAEVQATRAVACARDLLAAIQHKHHFRLRIGIHQGMATVGIFGSEKRSDFTAIGSTVNIASRIEGQAQPQEILLSETVAQHLPEDKVVDRGYYELRGVVHPVRLFSARTEYSISQAS